MALIRSKQAVAGGFSGGSGHVKGTYGSSFARVLRDKAVEGRPVARAIHRAMPSSIGRSPLGIAMSTEKI